MNDFVDLYWKRNRGWPWPEDTWGLTPMYGEDGWCSSCGVPKGPQRNPITLQRKGMKVHGGWIPYWQHNAICVEKSIAKEVASLFNVELLPVQWHATAPGDAMQLVVPSIGKSWFDSGELHDRATAQYGSPGAECSDCKVWRWKPLTFGKLPPLRISPGLHDIDIAASPEWFGDGCMAFRQILVRRELAELLAAASPRDFKVQDVG